MRFALLTISRVALLAVICLSALPVQGAVITAYTIFGVGDSSDGDSDAIYGYTALNVAPTLIVDVPTTVTTGGVTTNLGFVNGLATDFSRDRLLMIRDGASPGTGSSLYAMNVTTLSFTNLGVIGTANIGLFNTSGGGGIHNGSYYYWDDENGTGSGTNMGLMRVDFTGTGAISSVNQIWVNDGGDFGDLAFNPVTGLMYGVSNLPTVGGGGFDFWTLDVNNVGLGRSVLANNRPYQQIAFDNDGNLIGVELQANGAGARNWYTINPTNGNVISTITRPVVAGPPGFDFDMYDLANGGRVPEPGTYALMALAAAGFVWHRRRRKARATSESD